MNTSQNKIPIVEIGEYLFGSSGCRAATTPPRAAAERLARAARLPGSLCAAGRGATRRGATSSTTLNRYIGEANFESEVLRWNQPVLVAFSAAWSRPCQILDSVLEEVAAACAGRVKVVKINADNNPDLSLVLKIQSIPTLLYFVDGNFRGRIVGTASKEAILSKLGSVTHDGDSKILNPNAKQ